jgi:hypothetical protein
MSPLDLLVSLTVQFFSLLGVAALIAVLVNLGKIIGVVKDGTAMYWASGLGLIAFVTLAVLGIFRPDLSTVFLDHVALQIATVLTFILGFITQIVAAPWFHGMLSAGSVPLIGKSFTPKTTS